MATTETGAKAGVTRFNTETTEDMEHVQGWMDDKAGSRAEPDEASAAYTRA